MLARALAKLTWWTTKTTVKYVVVPIALTAFWATVAEKISEEMHATPNGAIDPALKPAP